MSDPQSSSITGVGGAGYAAADPRAAIARAAAATGVDFRYLLAQARLESSLDPTARAGASSAAGLYQFTNATWLHTLGRHGAEHGLGNGVGARADALGLRYDPDAAALMAAELARDNRATLAGQLGREPDGAELYLAHFLGAAGASQLLAADPSASAAALLPRAASANPTIFYAGGGGGARSVGGVIALLRARFGQALAAGDGAGATMAAAATTSGDTAGLDAPFDLPAPYVASMSDARPLAPGGGPIARAFHAASISAATAAPAPAGRSMAETLSTAFGLDAADGAGGGGANVRAAYARLRTLGL